MADDPKGFVRIPNPMTAQPHSAPALRSIYNGKNPFLRCLVPQVLATNSDSLRQFYEQGVPQYRIIPPLNHGNGPNNT